MAVISASRRNAAFGQPGKVDRTTVRTPWGINVVCHVLVADRFEQACKEASKLAWKPKRIDSFVTRPIRGTENDPVPKWSMHAYALAWDFFATPPNVPPPGGVWTPHNGVPAAFAACFERQGFRWGGKWRSRPDTPHIEWADEPPKNGPVPLPKPQQPSQPKGEPDMKYIVRKSSSAQHWITDGIVKRAINDITEAQSLVFLGVATWDSSGSGAAIVWPDTIVDDLHTLTRG